MRAEAEANAHKQLEVSAPPSCTAACRCGGLVSVCGAWPAKRQLRLFGLVVAAHQLRLLNFFRTR